MRKHAVILILFLLAAGGLAAEGDVHYARSRTVLLPCTIQSGADGIKEIEIWVSENDGETWKKMAVKTAEAGRLECKVDKDGIFGFLTVVLGNNNLKEEAPAEGDKPDLYFVVDTVDPVIKITSTSEDRVLKPGESAAFTWEIKDENIDTESCSLMSSVDGGKSWAATSQAELFGRKVFTGTSKVNPAVFKVSAADYAGNMAAEVIAFSIIREVPKPEPVAEKPVPVAEEPVEVAQSEPVAEEPVEVAQPEPVAEEPVEVAQPEPAAEEPVEAAQPEPVAEEPVEAAQPEPAVEEPVEDTPVREKVKILTGAGGEEFFTEPVEIEDSGYVPPIIQEPRRVIPGNEGDVVILDTEGRKEPSRKPIAKEPDEILAEAQPIKAEPSAKPVPMSAALDGEAVRACRKGMDHEVFDEFRDAAKWYAYALKKEPKYYLARKNLADLYFRNGYFKQALKHYQLILAINPNDAGIMTLHAYCLYKLEDLVEAEKRLKRVLQLSPGDLDAQWYLSKIYKESKQVDDAVYLWVKIVNKGPDDNKWYDFANNYLTIYSSRTGP